MKTHAHSLWLIAALVALAFAAYSLHGKDTVERNRLPSFYG